MPPSAIFFIGIFTTAMLVIFVYVSFHEIRTDSAGVTTFRGLLPISEGTSDLALPAARPLRVLLATDGSPCSDRAVQSVAMRPWPADSQIEVVSVIHTRVPDIVDAPLLMVAAAHEDALDADRLRAPLRVQRAEKCLAAKPGVVVTSRVLEGNPEDAILDEADRWQADVVVLGSHGYGPMTRRLLGSVSHAVALHAPCSVEIVRCPHGAA